MLMTVSMLMRECYTCRYLVKVNTLLSVLKEKDQELFPPLYFLDIKSHSVKVQKLFMYRCLASLKILNFLGSIFIHHINISRLEVTVFEVELL